ncbi:MAG: hypothetical protein EOP93_24780, partial [Lysobacteraceae bacterium]
MTSKGVSARISATRSSNSLMRRTIAARRRCHNRGMSEDITQALAGIRDRALRRVRDAGCDTSGCEDAIGRVAVASDFAIHTLATQPGLLARLRADSRTALPMPVLDAGNRDDWARLLRRHRHAESTRLVWRDVVDGAAVDEILAGSTALADACLQAALAALE